MATTSAHVFDTGVETFQQDVIERSLTTPVLLDFWATWCGPCIMQLPSLKELYEKNKDKGFVVIGISADRELDQLRSFIKERDVPWKQIFEPELQDGNVGMIYGVAKYPTTVLIDREGVIKAIDAHGEALDEMVDDLLKEQKK